MDPFKDCRVLQLAEELRMTIYDETTRLKSIEHYNSGVARQLRSHSNNLCIEIRAAWIMPAGSNKATHFSKALAHAEEIKRLMEISAKIDNTQVWENPRKFVAEQIIPKLHKLVAKARDKTPNKNNQ
jgi:hypothetical protein